MKRSEVQNKVNSCSEQLTSKIQASPLKMAGILVGIGYLAGALWCFTLPMLIIGAFVGVIFWFIAEDEVKYSGGSDSDKKSEEKSDKSKG